MMNRSLDNVQVSLIVSLFLLATGSVCLHFRYDFFAGLGIFAGLTVVAMSARV